MQDDEDTDWSRTDWARWWLDRGDVDSAAEWLREGDEVRSNDEEFDALASAVARRGLRALHAEGVAYVYTPEEAARIEDRIEEMASARRGPSRTTPVPVRRRKTA